MEKIDGHYEFNGHRLTEGNTNFAALKSRFVNGLVQNITDRWIKHIKRGKHTIFEDLKVPSRWKTTIKVLFLYYVLPCIYYDFVSCTFTPYSFIIFLHLVNKLYVLINVLFIFPKKSLIDAFCVIAMRTINFEDDIIQYGIQEIDFLLKHYGEEKVYINWLP